MKKIFTMAAIAAATILAVSCAKEIEEDIQKEGITAHASLQPVEATKAIGEYSYNIVWEENDKIAVLDKANNKASFKLTTGAGTTTGTFQQEGTDALTAPLTAYYPASVVAEDKSFVWPATQADVANISNVPMTAGSSTATGDVYFAFKHLGSVLQLVLTAKNGEINVKQIDITADQGLSGAFTVENGVAKISNTGTTISTGDISDKNIKLSATASYLNFAVPAGDFTNFKITITDIHDKTYSLSAASLTLERAMVNKVTFAMDAKDPALFEVNVNGHTVRVKLADDTPASDAPLLVYVEGENVKIIAVSKTNKPLRCTRDDNAEVPAPIFANGLYTFTLSNISKDIVSTVEYDQFTVHFYLLSHGQTALEDISVMRGAEINATASSDDGYEFRGWYMESSCMNAWNWEQIQANKTDDIKLYAKWVTKINGHECVKLAGYYWATENVIEGGVGYHVKDRNDTYGYYYTQTNDYALNAAKSWGSESGHTWTLPSGSQFEALLQNCTWIWTSKHFYPFRGGRYVPGMIVTGKEENGEEGHSIFLPAAGVVSDNYDGSSEFRHLGSSGYYWSSDSGNRLHFKNGEQGQHSDVPSSGMSVRPVAE